jgi:hypothetical protein
LSALIALEQLQIAPAFLNILFAAIVGAAAIAVGLAFGLGGQDTVRTWLNRRESTGSEAAPQLQAHHSTSQTTAAAGKQVQAANQMRSARQPR